MPTDDRHESMEAARNWSDLTVQQLWLRYVALGGTSDAFDVDGYLQGLMPLDSFQQDMLAQAVNEGLDELHRSLQVPLSAPSADGGADSVLHAVIRRLLVAEPNTEGSMIAESPDNAVADPADQPPASPPGSSPDTP